VAVGVKALCGIDPSLSRDFRGDQNRIAKLALLDCIERTVGHLFRGCEVHARLDESLKAEKDLRTDQRHTDLLNHLGAPVVKLDFFQVESCRTQVISISFNRLGISDADDPGEQAIQLLGERGCAREVAQSCASA
jgi:hypothetical protein